MLMKDQMAWERTSNPSSYKEALQLILLTYIYIYIYHTNGRFLGLFKTPVVRFLFLWTASLYEIIYLKTCASHRSLLKRVQTPLMKVGLINYATRHASSLKVQSYAEEYFAGEQEHVQQKYNNHTTYHYWFMLHCSVSIWPGTK